MKATFSVGSDPNPHAGIPIDRTSSRVVEGRFISNQIQLHIDGYCYLSSDRASGLGVYLYEAIDRRTHVIGIAKNRYQNSTHAEEVVRGGSTRPLFVTSLGLPQDVAASRIASMAGRHRIPALVKAVDQLARAQR